jgi:serine/threonine protein kinase
MSEEENKIDWSSNSIRVNLRLPEEVYSEIKKHAKKTWKSISTVLSQGLWTYIKDKFIEEERRKEIWDIIWELTIEELENEVIEFINTNPIEFAFWTEAKIYKMHIPWKKEDVLVVKRKYKWTSTSEFYLHSKAKEIELLLKHKQIENNVHIPTLFHHFNKEWEEYILMEYIKWKTLYLMIIESILSKQTIAYWDRIKDENAKKEFYYVFYDILKDKGNLDLDFWEFSSLSIDEIKNILSDENWILKEIDIENDLDWENILKYLYWMINDLNIEKNNIDAVMEMTWWLKINKFLYDLINNSNLSKLWIFSTIQWLHLSKNISKFLTEMHSEGLYHRDLGSNTRNIILTKWDDWLYIANIIDFWKSIILTNNITDYEAYREENADSSITKFTDDKMIVSKYIEPLSWEKIENYKLIDKDKEKKLKDIYEIWEKFNIKKEDIEISFNSISRYKNMVYFDRLKDILYKREIVWWYKLNLSNTRNTSLKLEREEDKSRVLADIIVLMYFAKNENFNKIMSFIWNLEYDEKFKPTLKTKYIDLYKQIFIEVRKKRKD